MGFLCLILFSAFFLLALSSFCFFFSSSLRGLLPVPYLPVCSYLGRILSLSTSFSFSSISFSLPSHHCVKKAGWVNNGFRFFSFSFFLNERMGISLKGCFTFAYLRGFFSQRCFLVSIYPRGINSLAFQVSTLSSLALHKL